MIDMNNKSAAALKAWSKPELTRIEAGSAENGPRAQQPDGNIASGGFNS